MDLREELARSFYAIAGAIGGWPLKYRWDSPDAIEMTKKQTLAMADECLRQMEWARRECIVDDSPQMDGGPGGAMVRSSDYHNAPCTLWDAENQKSGPTVTIDDPRHPHYGTDWKASITLAPPDWKP